MTLAQQAGTIRVRDTEVVQHGDFTAMMYAEFNPAPAKGLSRLAKYAALFERYKIHRITIHYRSTSGTATEGSVTVGVGTGPKMTNIANSTQILALRPSFTVPAWKDDRIVLGNDIMQSRTMAVGGTDQTGVAFTLYAIASKKDPGQLFVEYDIEFSFPTI